MEALEGLFRLLRNLLAAQSRQVQSKKLSDCCAPSSISAQSRHLDSCMSYFTDGALAQQPFT